MLVMRCIAGKNPELKELNFLAQQVKNPPAVQETQVQFLGWEDPLEKEIATHSSSDCSSDCGNEIKRHLLLGRKVMTNLDSIFKSRDITLPTKVHLVKAMVFPVVVYGCESWTIEKADH